MKISFDLSQMKKALDEKKEQIHSAARPAAQAGAQILYDAARLNVHSSTKGHWFHGTQYRKDGTKYWFDAGTLLGSIYQVYSRRNSNDAVSTYHVSWNMNECPYAHMVEFGHSKRGGGRVPAHSFIGKAVHEYSDEAGKAMRVEFLDRIKA